MLSFHTFTLVGLAIWFQLPETESQARIPFGCEADYCNNKVYKDKKTNCPPGDDKHVGRILKNSSVPCGCCHVYMDVIKKNANCAVEERSRIPRAECGPLMKCDKTLKCVHLDTDCIRAFYEWKDETMGEPQPICDESGNYEAVQCKTDVMCYCVSKDGKRLFGSAPYTEKQNTNCRCSRDYDDLLKDGLVSKDDPTQFLRCNSYGSYDGPQCTQQQCFCIGQDGDLKSPPVARRNGTKVLPCFEEKIHQNDFITPCLKELSDLKIQIASHTKRGITIVGIELPSCDLDGSYSPKQCKGANCYCVDRQGTTFLETLVPRYSEDSEKMLCNCVREKQMLSKFKEDQDKRTLRQFVQYKCYKNGNYLKVQCTSSVCFCVNDYGWTSAPSKPILLNRRKELACYNEDYENYLGIMWD